jgi:predicted ABC-type transport system involved in lysophospholipase L1 biosynthesis ATPase subunit
MSNEIILEARDIRREFVLLRNRIAVLQGVDLEILKGEALAIMGASGAGKSTLLHVLGGLDRPTNGAVRYKDADLYRLSAARRADIRAHSFGFVFQSYHLLPELSVLENVLLPVMHRWNWVRKAAAYRAHAEELLDQVGLQHRARHRPMELSGGEQQRAALARALMNEPEIVFADEPTGNLDSQTGETVLRYLFQLTRERGHTLVLVTHNDAVAAACDRTLHMRDGRLANGEH